MQALRLEAVELPVEFGTASERLEEAVRGLRPRLVVAVGLAAGRTAITPERVAINIRDARIPDNAGASPVDEPVVPGAPVGRFSTLPVKAMVASLAADGVPAAVSQTAGTYVCNDVFYALQHLLATDPALEGIRGAERLALVLGQEGPGVREETLAQTDADVVIPMPDGVDSLNVAAAAAVALWELRAR